MSPQRLQQEIKKRHGFEVPEQEAMLNIVRTCDQLQIRFCRLFREYGLTSPQYNILRILRGEGKPLPILEIASRMLTVVPGITGLIDRLEKAGLVRRERSTTDRRVVFATITPKALELLEQLDLPVVHLHRELMGHLTAEELNEIIRLMEKARENLEPVCDAPE